MPISTLEDLFLHTLKDVLYAERSILRALPGLESKATDAKQKAALTLHRKETEGHVFRLAKVFDSLGEPARAERSDAMVGPGCGNVSPLSDTVEVQTLDAALLSLTQAAGYAIARYGTLVVWAKQLGHSKAAVFLQATLEKQRNAATALSQLLQERQYAAAFARGETFLHAAPNFDAPRVSAANR